jgi:hypothetical protein
MFFVGDLVENGHWKHIEDISTDRCAIPTIRRLAANLKTEKAFSAITTQTYHCGSIL